MITLAWAFHQFVLRHGDAWVELTGTETRDHGTLIECPCGRRWLGRAPWFR